MLKNFLGEETRPILQATANANVFLRDMLSCTSNLSVCDTEADTQAEKTLCALIRHPM